ncbi:MAG: SDR family NAD(P)-dependent oxidoreductase, partial [Thauera sp.]|nr:SDR family NAD(P)-dependent oxidoreductase [Thauera sp.]
MSFSLEGQVALVTGASRGIGAGIAEALAAHGAAVGVNYATGQKEADEVVARIVAAGGRAIPVQADVSKAADVDRMAEQVAEALGPITIVVNNAGLTDTHRP